MLKEAAVA